MVEEGNGGMVKNQRVEATSAELENHVPVVMSHASARVGWTTNRLREFVIMVKLSV